MLENKKKCIVILASTFPRWKDDSVPTFVYDHAVNMKDYFTKVIVIAPHFKGSKTKEMMDGIEIRRFRYFLPAKGENIAYGNYKFNNGVSAKVKSVLYVLSESISTNWAVAWFKPEVVNAHWMIPQGFVGIMAKKLFRTKLITTVHGGDIYTLNGRLMQKLKRFVIKNSDAVTVNSKSTKIVCNKLYERDYCLIPPVIDIEAFSSIDTSKKKSMKNSLNIIYVGRLSEEKGVIYLLEAAKLLINNGKPNIRVSIVGDGPEKARLAAWVEENNLSRYIIFKGWRQRHELVGLYSNADVFVGPSIKSESGWVEAFGIVFAEAASAGLPVLTTDTGGMVDIVDDGVSGYIVQEKNIEQISDRLEELYINTKKRINMGNEARRIAISRFSRSKVSGNWNQLISKVTN